MASYPAEGRDIMLNVRIAPPPWDRAKNGWMDVNPGVASSYIFAKKRTLFPRSQRTRYTLTDTIVVNVV